MKKEMNKEMNNKPNALLFSYQDDFEAHFGGGRDEEERFLASMREYVDDGSWEKVTIQNLKVATAESMSAEATDAEKFQVYVDTVEHTNLYLKTRKWRLPLGSTAMPTLLARCRVEGTVFRDLTPAEMKSTLNTFLKYGKGQALVRVASGKIRALHGGSENGGYTPLDMSELFNEAKESLKQFHGVSFKEGFIDHRMATALWKVEDQRIADAYREVFNRDGDIAGLVRVASSDVGISGANLYYHVLVNGHNVFAGTDLKLEHDAHDCSVQKFRENADMAFPRFRDSLQELKKLENIRISYPLDCLRHAMKSKHFSAKAISECVSWHESMMGTGPCTALDLYYAICHAAEIVDTKNQRLALDLEEKIISCLGMHWLSHDYRGEEKAEKQEKPKKKQKRAA